MSFKTNADRIDRLAALALREEVVVVSGSKTVRALARGREGAQEIIPHREIHAAGTGTELRRKRCTSAIGMQPALPQKPYTLTGHVATARQINMEINPLFTR
jgi:hypothetical protein